MVFSPTPLTPALSLKGRGGFIIGSEGALHPLPYMQPPLTPAPLPWRERDKGRGGLIVD